MNPKFTILIGIIGTILVLSATPALSERYSRDVILEGTAQPTEKVSGFKGADFTIGVPDSEGDEYALYGITSEEKKDNPCYVTIKTENINDSSQKLELKKNLCGGKERSKEMQAFFGDKNYGKRSFITGIRVCLNNKGDRVKGIQVRGKTISDEGNLDKLTTQHQDKKAGSLSRMAPEEPKDNRPNCNNNWKKWAQCPGDQIATAAILHYEAGKEPRSLTGIALQCKRVSKKGGGAIRRE